MRLFFITTTGEIQVPCEIKDAGHQLYKSVRTHDKLSIEDLDIIEAFDDEAIVYVIDVHCVIRAFDNVGGQTLCEKLQEQGGVTIYRHLLKAYESAQRELKYFHNSLKVIFYSPVSQNQLVALKPENYVLKLLPFIELMDTGSFARDLHERITDFEVNGWPQFNNSSENLLSGWAWANKKKIKRGKDQDAKILLNGIKLLAIDDEFASWQSTYSTIFETKTNGSSGRILFPPFESQASFRKAWKKGAIDSIIDLAQECNAVLSDLYIAENHEDTSPYKTIKDLERISGYELFKRIKKQFPYLPYMMFTSSSKVWNAEAFRAEGVWAWAVKETGARVVNQEKKSQFEHFESSLRKLIEPECGLLANVWKRLLILKQKSHNVAWWHANEPDAVDILEECLFILDTVFSQRATFETNKIGDFEGRLCSQIFNNLGGLCEELGIAPKDKDRNKADQCVVVSSFVFELRSFYSHKLHYRKAKRLLTLFCIDLFLGLLELGAIAYGNLNKDEENLILKDDFIENTDFNYFLQLEAKCNFWGIHYDSELYAAVKKSFGGVTVGILSNKYKSAIDRKLRELAESRRATVEFIERRKSVINLTEPAYAAPNNGN